MDAGIIAWLKQTYKYRLLARLLDIIDDMDALKTAAAAKSSGTAGLTEGRLPNVLDAMKLMAGAAEDLTPRTIASCWLKCEPILPARHVATLKEMVAALKPPKKAVTASGTQQQPKPKKVTADAGLDDLVARLRGVSLAGLNAEGDVNNDPMAAVAEAVLAVQPATAEAALKDWIVFDDADEVIIDMLTGEDVDDVVDDLLAEEGDDDQSDDEAAAVAGPTNSETFATLNEKARAAGQAAFAAQHSSWTAATRQYVLDAAAPFLFLMEHSPAPPEAVQLMQRLKVVLLKPTQKRKQAALHSFFSKVNRREALVAAARAGGGDGAGGDGGDGDSEGGGGGDADAESDDAGSCVEEVGEESDGVEE